MYTPNFSDGPLMHMSWFCRKCHHAAHPHHILEWFTVSEVLRELVPNCLISCLQTVDGQSRYSPFVEILHQVIPSIFHLLHIFLTSSPFKNL